MLIVEIKNGMTLDRALKILKNKVIKTKQTKELKERESFMKSSVKRRNEMKKAIYNQKLKENEDNG
jgi:small subunit ribosomal protein S21